MAQWVIVVPLRGSILQAGTCQLLRLAWNPRWSWERQYKVVGVHRTWDVWMLEMTSSSQWRKNGDGIKAGWRSVSWARRQGSYWVQKFLELSIVHAGNSRIHEIYHWGREGRGILVTHAWIQDQRGGRDLLDFRYFRKLSTTNVMVKRISSGWNSKYKMNWSGDREMHIWGMRTGSWGGCGPVWKEVPDTWIHPKAVKEDIT